MTWKNTNKVISLALAGVITLGLQGCGGGGDKKTTTTPTTPTTTTNTDKTIKIREFVSLDKDALGGKSDVDFITVSGDGKVYVVADGKKLLRMNPMADAKDLTDKNKWADVNYKVAGPTTAAVGKAPTDTVTGVLGISPASDGVVLYLDHGTPASKAVSYFKGSTQEFACNAAATYVDSATELLGGVAATNATGEIVAVLRNDNKVVSSAGTFTSPAVLNKVLTRNGTTAFAAGSKMISDVATGNFYVVSADGVNAFIKADLTNGKQPTAAPTGELDAGKWKMDSSINNNKVAALAFADKHLYIGLTADTTPANTGGVAVIDFSGAAAAAKPMKKDLEKVSVTGFAVNGKDVYAVFNDGVVHVKSDGSVGEKITAADVKMADEKYASAKDGFKGTAPEAGKVTAAAFVKEQLLIGTSNKGIIILKREENVKVKASN